MPSHTPRLFAPAIDSAHLGVNGATGTGKRPARFRKNLGAAGEGLNSPTSPLTKGCSN